MVARYSIHSIDGVINTQYLHSNHIDMIHTVQITISMHSKVNFEYYPRQSKSLLLTQFARYGKEKPRHL